MLKSYTLWIDQVGNVLFERSLRAKHLNISVKPFHGIRVAVPRGMSFRKAEKIVISKRDWIQRHLARMKRAREKYDSILSQHPPLSRSSAREKLINRLKELSENYGYTYNRVFIRNQKTIWGSCSMRNNINLNIKLVWLPGDLMDYVILHELVHTRIKNHSSEFWQEMDRLTYDLVDVRSERAVRARQPYPSGAAKKLSARLKEFGLGFM